MWKNPENSECYSHQIFIIYLPEVLEGLPYSFFRGLLIDGETLRSGRVEHNPHVGNVVGFAWNLRYHNSV